MFTCLPTELTLAILADLPLSSLAVIPLVCKHWLNFVQVNENIIYRNASVYHGYTRSPAVSIEQVHAMYSERAVGSGTDWKTFCRKCQYLEKSWSGKLPSSITPHYSTGKTVHRFKIDERAGYIICTTRMGLRVIDLNGAGDLWSLSPDYVRAYAHCEYGDGFIVFDHTEGTKEVWRCASDYTAHEAAAVVPESRPAQRQIEAFEAAQDQYAPDQSLDPDPATLQPQRGQFRPWALLRPLPSDRTRAFRLAHGVLGAPSYNNIYIWDLRTGALIQRISDIQLVDYAHVEDGLGDINYIEMSEKYIFVCGHFALRVYERGTGDGTGRAKGEEGGLGRCVMSLSPRYAVRWKVTVETNLLTNSGGAQVVEGSVVGMGNGPAHQMPDFRDDEFCAVHVSSCGSHIAVLTRNARVVLIPNFEDLFFGKSTSLSQRGIEVDFNCHLSLENSLYLAFEHGRVAAATTTGIFIIEPDWSDSIFSIRTTTASDQTRPDDARLPRISIWSIPAFDDIDFLDTVSCLQMTDTGLWVNWTPYVFPTSVEPPDFVFGSHPSTVVSVDFMEPEEDI